MQPLESDDRARSAPVVQHQSLRGDLGWTASRQRRVLHQRRVLAALLLGYYVPVEDMGGWNIPGVIPAAAVFMMVVGLLTAAGPARRGLRIEPTEALRDG